MNRFFVEPRQVWNGQARIVGEDVKHIAQVLRLGPGDTVILCDGAGTDYTARIVAASKEEVRLSLVESAPVRTEPQHKVTLYQGLPKAGKLEVIVQKCVELGLFSLTPIQAQRSVVKVSPQAFEKKRLRYQRVAYEAAKQARRGIIPQVAPLQTFAQTDMARHDLVLVADEEEREASLKDILRAHATARDIALVIGPEGGLERSEVAALRAKGGLCLSLGPRILRTETAGMAALAMILYEMEAFS